MDPLLDLLKKNARESEDVLGRMLNVPATEIRSRLAAYERTGVIRGYQAVINEERAGTGDVRAAIELRIRPERNGGYDRIAQRLGQFPQVESLFLMSGGYDLLLFVRGRNLQEVASFVSSELAPLEGVLSTATHFMLKTYKDQGTLMENAQHDDRLQVTP
jgi:DNA-binding Lrp family transcriptional regulator